MATFAGALVTGAFTGTATGTPYQPIANKPFNVFLTGTFAGTFSLARSYDGGVTYATVPLPDITDAATFTTPVNFVVIEPDAAVLYAWVCSAYTSGTASYRMG